MTVWRMRLASWIPKATDTHSEYEKRIALPRKQWLRERALILRYTYTAPFVNPTDMSVFSN